MRITQVVPVILLCVISLFGLAYFYNSSESPAARTGSLQRPAPAFALPDANGKMHHLQDFKGEWVILHFWASWCAPCLEEIPQWVELASYFTEYSKTQKVRLVAISLDQNWDDAHKILPTDRLNGKVISLLDLSGKVPDDFGSFQFPETYLIGPDSTVRFKWVGPQNWGSQETRDAIAKKCSLSLGS